MNTQTLNERYNELRYEVTLLIEKYIRENECGDIHNSEEEYYELPRTFYVDKHGFYNEYAILGARIEDGKLIFDGFGLSDYNYGHDMAFYEHELELPTLMYVLEELNSIPQPVKP